MSLYNFVILIFFLENPKKLALKLFIYLNAKIVNSGSRQGLDMIYKKVWRIAHQFHFFGFYGVLAYVLVSSVGFKVDGLAYKL